MGDKKNEMKFTILFSRANPDHIFAADRLNAQSRNNKANYVAQAIRFFEENGNLNKSIIEQAIIDILSRQTFQTHTTLNENITEMHPDNKLKENITGALEIFRQSGNKA